MPQKQTMSDLKLEQYRLGELSAADSTRVREALAEDGELRARLSALDDSDREIQAAYPAERVVGEIRERLIREGAGAPRTRRTVQPIAWGIAVAAMALVVFSVVISRQSFVGDGTRLKGLTPHLSVFRKTLAGAEELRAGALARSGDVLQLSYAAGEARYGVIFSVDGRGSVTWHLPSGASGTAPALDQQGLVVLSSAYELDDAPGFERFFLVYGATPFSVEDVARTIRALASRPSKAERETLPLPHGLGQYSLLVKKQG
jgi:hypothetical protein